MMPPGQGNLMVKRGSNVLLSYVGGMASGSYSGQGILTQYVCFGGSDWDGIQWYNGNSGKVEVTYSVKLSDGSTTNKISLKPDETSGVSALAKGARVDSISVKSIK